MKLYTIKFILLLLLFSVLPTITFAKEYYYNSIIVDLKINKDSTVNIDEKLDFHFNGEFHKGWRSIPLSGMDTITNIEVYDEFGKRLKYSHGAHDKLDKHSWGKYTTHKRDNQQIIEWYYSSEAVDKTQSWDKTFVLKYTVNGAVTSYYNKGVDELYWNFFTDYDVPVMYISGTVLLPKHGARWSDEDIQYSLYTKPKKGNEVNFVDTHASNGIKAVQYSFDKIFPPHSKATLAIAWPHGYVDTQTQKEHWLSVFYKFFGVLAIVGALIFALLIWIFTEWLPMKSKTIIPRYAPPHDYSPVVVDIIMHEGFTEKTLPALVIDLANRGYWTIREKKERAYAKFFGYILTLIVAILVSYLIIITAMPKIVSALHTVSIKNIGYLEISFSLFILSPLIYFILDVGMSICKGVYKVATKQYDLMYDIEYMIRKKEKTKGGVRLLKSEQAFVDILFKYGVNIVGGEFSTKVFKKAAKNRLVGREIRTKLRNTHISFLKEVDGLFKGFNPKLFSEYVFTVSFVIAVVVTFVVVLWIFNNLNFALVAVAVVIILRTILEARLTSKGRIQKAELLGFKMYLETAERYRLQNLTPETFELFLPYAMVFGVEKKWAETFEEAGITLEQPQWYSNSHSGSDFNNSGSSFSPAAFSTAIAGSFASAVSSSTGGASGGGGSAGGGSGGGGGGAS